jgi:transposase InsO family protein
LFVVPTIGFNLLYVLVIVRLARRELVWLNLTAHPTAEWIAQQITEAFPWNVAPRYMIRDQDAIYGPAVTRRLRAMGIRDKPIALGSPWQNCFAERLIGSIRRECIDHVVALGEQHLRQVLKSYANYYNTVRTHRSLDKDAPAARPVQRIGHIRVAWRTASSIRPNLSFRYTQVARALARSALTTAASRANPPRRCPSGISSSAIK